MLNLIMGRHQIFCFSLFATLSQAFSFRPSTFRSAAAGGTHGGATFPAAFCCLEAHFGGFCVLFLVVFGCFGWFLVCCCGEFLWSCFSVVWCFLILVIFCLFGGLLVVSWL